MTSIYLKLKFSFNCYTLQMGQFEFSLQKKLDAINEKYLLLPPPSFPHFEKIIRTHSIITAKFQLRKTNETPNLYKRWKLK